MDAFRKHQLGQCGPGGLRCPCCADYINRKDRAKVNRRARQRLRTEDLRLEGIEPSHSPWEGDRLPLHHRR